MANSLPTGCKLRPAIATDMGAIRKLVLGALLDPTQLHWSQFWVIEHEGGVIACGQLRSFGEAQELGSLVVAPAWRNQGLGQYLIKHLIATATQPLYLECLGRKLAEMYRRFGFVPVEWRSLPPSLKRKFRLSHLAAQVLRVPVTIMQYQGSGQQD